MNTNKFIDSKLILRGIGLAFTAIGLAAQFCSTMVNNKREQIEMREAVQKEVARQLAIPMKRDP
jgi:hypothetical protein